jgi:hypothetical protein
MGNFIVNNGLQVLGGTAITGSASISSTLSVGATAITGSASVSSTLTATTLVETSAIRYKENIQNLESFDNIYKLRPVSFDWKLNNNPDIGFIAEEVNELFPLLVESNEDGVIEGIKYSKMVTVIVKTLQNQQQQIEELKQEINTLKNK